MALGGGETRPGSADVEAVLIEFDSRVEALKSLCDKTKGLIEELLQDANVRYQSVQARVKNRKKLREKYLDPAKDYTKLDDIHDLAGLRVITYYDDEVDRVAEVIEREFDIDRENTDDKRKIELDRFGYSAINYVCTHLGTRASLREYRRFVNVRLEIQVTSILSHAWSEMNHGSYDLGESCPSEIRRRFFQLKALLELADSQFSDLRDKTTNYERAVAVQVEAKVPDLPLDAVSLKSFADQEPLVGEIDAELAAAVGTRAGGQINDKRAENLARLARLAGLVTVQQLRDSLNKYRKGVIQYLEGFRKIWPAVPNELRKGVSILHLANLLIFSQGEEKVAEVYKEMGEGKVRVDAESISRRVAIATEIMTNYPK